MSSNCRITELIGSSPYCRYAPWRIFAYQQEARVADQVKAYILIQTAVNAGHVAQEIRGLAGVEAADDVSGPYDVIVRTSAPDMDSLGKMVVAKIQSVEGITRTLTCPIVTL
jgi:DNA-binding Lrp family transcriptional regulator